jgi:hypothetical protein
MKKGGRRQASSLGPEISRAIEELRESRRQESRRLWGALMISLNIDVCHSILTGKPVLAGKLDGRVLHLALRGAQLPSPGEYVQVTAERLEAVAEAAPLNPVKPWEESRR